jgi:hypothetical protein
VDPGPARPPSGPAVRAKWNITGIELVEGEIRLVRWPDDDNQPLERVLARAPLREVFAES